jgi:hypothetical protein
VVVVCLAFVVAIAGGCAAGHHRMTSAKMAAAPHTQPTPPPLAKSEFSKDPHGQLTEDALQKILASPIELSLPSRVGVLPIATARDWRGPSPDERVPAGVANFVEALRRDAAFSLVTQTMVIPSGALGMEALREVAARYRLRYLMLYREVLAKKTKLNPWASGYATLVGMFFLPGQQHEVYGYIEASMFDVKTGLLMFTTRRSINASEKATMWYGTDKIDRLASIATSKFSPDLAADALSDLRRFANAAVAENAQKGAPNLVQTPTQPTPSVATDSH